MQSPFNTRGNPFDLGHVPYLRLNTLTATPLSAIDTKLTMQRMLRYLEHLNERLTKIEDGTANRGQAAAPAPDGVREKPETEVQRELAKRRAGKAAGAVGGDA